VAGAVGDCTAGFVGVDVAGFVGLGRVTGTVGGAGAG
jgi:hypothetical protein